MLRIKMIEYQDYPKMHKCLNHNKTFQYIHYTDGSTDLLHTYVSNYKTRVSYCSCCSNNPAFKKIRQDTFGVPETGHAWCTRDRTPLVYPRQDTLGVPETGYPWCTRDRTPLVYPTGHPWRCGGLLINCMLRAGAYSGF